MLSMAIVVAVVSRPPTRCGEAVEFSVKLEENGFVRLDGSTRPPAWTYFRIRAWGSLANAAERLDVGDEVLIIGRLGPYRYTSRTGERRWALDVTTVELLRRRQAA